MTPWRECTVALVAGAFSGRGEPQDTQAVQGVVMRLRLEEELDVAPLRAERPATASSMSWVTMVSVEKLGVSGTYRGPS